MGQYFRILSFQCIFFLTGFTLLGQEGAYTLREKVGLVRLYMNQPKIKHLEALINNGMLPEFDRRKAREELEKYLIDRKLYTSGLIESFDQNYNITPVYFIPDSLWRDFKSGKEGNYFLGNNGLIDEKIKLPFDRQYYIIAQENYDYDFRILNSEGVPPGNNFPYKLKHSLFSKIRGLMGDMATESVKRLNKQLKNYK